MTKIEDLLDKVTSLNFGIPEDFVSFFGAIADAVFKTPKCKPGERIALSFDNPKSTALCYDRLWSANVHVPDDIRFFIGSTPEMMAHIRTILFYSEKGGKAKGSLIEKGRLIKVPLIESWKRFLEEAPQFRQIYDPASPHQKIQNLRELSTFISDAVGAPIIPIFPSLRSRDSSYTEGDHEAVVTVLNNLQIVDENSLTWDQVAEFRKDKEARALYRRLIHWLDSKMTTKSLSYIEDDIALRYEDYLWSLRKHGINTLLGVLSSTLDYKTLLAGSATIASAAFAGQPSWGLLSAGGFVVGKMSVKAAKVLIDLKDIKKGPSGEIAFVHEVSKIKKKKTSNKGIEIDVD